MPPMMDRYGLGLPMGPAAMVCKRSVCFFVLFPELELCMLNFILLSCIGNRCFRCQLTFIIVMGSPSDFPFTWR